VRKIGPIGRRGKRVGASEKRGGKWCLGGPDGSEVCFMVVIGVLGGSCFGQDL
jgi:hypothetical protein